MSKEKNLKIIQNGLSIADQIIDGALKATREAKDKSGEKRIKKLSEHIKEVKKEFEKTQEQLNQEK